ncbi:MAG TPA: GDSL-type esterase/lipase family protein [Solirubrobacteraceae bacterium]|nr:GDSL-type esterase/lipase family protein [Solirubrobacteraceae bacterium]
MSAGLQQAGTALQLELRLSQIVPAGELDAGQGRVVCLVLSPDVPSRRRVCVGSRDGRLTAALEATDADGDAVGTPRVLRGARVLLNGDFLRLRAPARALHVRLGRTVAWRTAITWHDGGPCEASTDRLACVQQFPPGPPQQLPTRAPPRPASGRAPHLRLLATGDSMIQIVDGFLKAGLADRRATVVRSDAHISTGISKLGMLDWLHKAREQASSFKPDVTVITLGANDGFPMKTPSGASVGCCGAGWIAEYARRVASMMRSYRRGGRSLVYWMTLPAPRGGNFARVFNAINPAIRRAAARVGGGVRVIELGRVFTPGGHFRQLVTYHGRTVSARQPDGVHLSTAGARIAASLVIARLRADGALPRLR